MVADCKRFFPRHHVRESKGQRNGICYTSASGGKIPNEGEIDVVHEDDHGTQFGFTFQNAKVGCPILSVKKFTAMDCRVVVKKGGGVIYYPDGRTIPFIERLGVFFVAMNVLPPEAAELAKENHKHINDNMHQPQAHQFNRAQRKPSGFTRQGARL